MWVNVSLYGGLERRFKKKRFNKVVRMELPNAVTVKDLLKKLRLSSKVAKIVIVNGTHGDYNDILEEGDRIDIFPPVAGG